jgi:hypothetical protein
MSIQIPQKPLREIMLQVHETEIKSIYNLPKDKKLHYNKESTQICIDETPFFEYFSDKLSNPTFTSEMLQHRKIRKENIIKAHENPQKFSAEEIFNLQFDYELLALDHLIDTTKVNKIAMSLEKDIDTYYAQNYFLSPLTGKTFFDEIHIKDLESLGYQLVKKDNHSSEKNFFFENKGFQYFLKHTMTREKLIKIILDYESVKSKLEEKYNSLQKDNYQITTAAEIYDEIKETRINQMKRRGTWQQLVSKLPQKELNYITFVGNALDYNEDNRLLRSISFYHIMNNNNIGERFYELLESRKK